jgi:hypothetical protein
VHTEPRYRAVVTRETDEEAALNGALEKLNALEEIEETA